MLRLAPIRVPPMESFDGRIDSGLRLRAQGSSGRGRLPGAWGDAPGAAASCGFPIPPPEEQPIPTRAADSTGEEPGYGLKPAKKTTTRKKRGRPQNSDITPPRTGFVERKIGAAHGRWDLAPSPEDRSIMAREHPLSAPKRRQPGRDRKFDGDPLAVHDPRARVLSRADGRCRPDGHAHHRQAHRLDFNLAGCVPASLRSFLLDSVSGAGRRCQCHGRNHPPAHTRS